MNRFRNLIAVFAFSLLILGLPSIASAQWRNDRNDDYRNDRRNDDYNPRLFCFQRIVNPNCTNYDIEGTGNAR